MQQYSRKGKSAISNYYGPPLTSVKKEPNPYKHHYFNAIMHVLLNLEGQTFQQTSLRESLLNLFNQVPVSSMDEATQAIASVFKEFQEKCEEYERTQDEELLLQPTLPTGEALHSILDSSSIKEDSPLFYGSPDTEYCMFEYILASLRNLEVNKSGQFGSQPSGEGDSFIDSYFRGETTDTYDDVFCTYALPIPMKEIADEILASKGESKLLSTYISNRAENNKIAAIYDNLSQRYLLIKLDFNDVTFTDEEVQSLWIALEQKFDTSLLTQPSNEEHKGGNDNAELVAIIDRLNKDRSTNNNEVNILVDEKWRNMKTCIYKSNSFEHILEDCAFARRYPLVLVYKLLDNVPREPVPEPAPVQATPPQTASSEQPNPRDPTFKSMEELEKSKSKPFSAKDPAPEEPKRPVYRDPPREPEGGGCCCTIF